MEEVQVPLNKEDFMDTKIEYEDLKPDMNKIYKDLDEIIKAIGVLSLSPGYSNLKTYCNIVEALVELRNFADIKANSTTYSIGEK